MTVAVSKNMDENKNVNNNEMVDNTENENQQPSESPEELLKKVTALRKELDRLEKKEIRGRKERL